MSTNFYMRRIPTEEDKTTIRELADAQEYRMLSRFVDKLLDPIHLGKWSCGWKFIWNHNNGKYFNPCSKESLFEFLRNPNYEIYDENGTTYTPDSFLQAVEEWDNSPRNIHDDRSYEKWERENGNPTYSLRCYDDERGRIECMFGVSPIYHDFYLDGIRYSTSADFC